MSNLPTEDINLTSLNFDTLPRLQRLRERHFSSRPEVCLELPRLITRYMKERDDRADFLGLEVDELLKRSGESSRRAAQMYGYVLKNKAAVIEDESLLAGATTTKAIGVLVYPDLMGICIWPELETISARKQNPFKISAADIAELNFEIFPYWMNRTVQEIARKDYGNPLCQRMLERIIFFLASKIYCISHTVPDYKSVLDKGLLGIKQEAEERINSLGASKEDQNKQEFYRGVGLVCDGIAAYAKKLSRRARSLAETAEGEEWRNELLEMSRVCEHVPAHTPRNFREALNAVWICKVALHQENTNAAMSLGRLDQVLYPYYQMDIQAGVSEERIAELIGCFWLKMADHVPLSPETGEELFGGAGSNQAITLGGVDKDGKNAVNRLTYLMLRVTELLKLRDPNVNVRYNPKLEDEEKNDRYLRRLCEVNINTGATPCFHSDEPIINSLMGQGVSQEDARDYAIVGCVEPGSSGRTYAATSSILLNLTSALELTLFEGKHRLTEDEVFPPPDRIRKISEIKTFPEFKEALKSSLGWIIDEAVTMNENLARAHQKMHPTPIMSTLMEGCLEKGQDVIYGGATYNFSGVTIIGLSEVVDSLNAIEEFVFTKKETTLGEMIEAIKNNWEGYQILHAKVKTSTEKYGTDSPMAAGNADFLIDYLHTTFQGKTNYRGGKYCVGYWTMTNHAGFGVLTGALPSGRSSVKSTEGRLIGEPLPSGITPVSGSAPQLTSCLNFMAHLDQMKIVNSHALNIKYTPSTTTGKKFADTIKAFAKMGGRQVQFNIIDRKTLEEARKRPQDFRDLLVRVSGYTAYFVDLNPHIIITRAEYNLNNGQEVNCQD